MNGNGLSAGDILALTKENGGFLEGNGILIVLFFFLAFTGGLGGFGGNGAYQVPATKDYVSDRFNNQNVINGLSGLSKDVTTGTYEMKSAVAEAQASLQKCCCDTNRNIDALRYDNEKTGASIVSAIHADGEATRKVISDAITQNLRDQLDQARDVISNTNQSRYILDQLGNYYTKPPCYPQYTCGGPCGNLYA